MPPPRHQLLLPKGYLNASMYPWIIVYFAGGDGHPPEFFPTHGRNFAKFDTEEKRRQGYIIQGHVKDKEDVPIVIKYLNEQLKGPRGKALRYQSTHSKTSIDIKSMKKD